MLLNWPLAGDYPISRDSQGHLNDGQLEAVDLACPLLTSVLAVQSGTVVRQGYLGDCGFSIDLVTPDRWVWRYCHLEAQMLLLNKVEVGQVIGAVGMTGLTTGPHLHLALFIGNQRERPERYLLEGQQMQSILKSIDVGWERLDEIQRWANLMVDDPTLDPKWIIECAEEVKQNSLVQIKIVVGLQEE